MLSKSLDALSIKFDQSIKFFLCQDAELSVATSDPKLNFLLLFLIQVGSEGYAESLSFLRHGRVLRSPHLLVHEHLQVLKNLPKAAHIVLELQIGHLEGPHVAPHPLKARLLVVLQFLFRIFILITLLGDEAFVAIVLVEELPASLLVEWGVNGRPSADRLRHILHNRLLLIVWDNVCAAPSRILLHEAKDDRFFIFTALTAHPEFHKVDHDLLLDPTKFLDLNRMEKIA